MKDNNKYKLIQEAAYEANMQLPLLRLVVFTFGNVSAADHDLCVFAIKPSGVPYDQLSPKKLVVVDFDGKTVKGSLRPSSDTKTHAVLYKHWGHCSHPFHFCNSLGAIATLDPCVWNNACRPQYGKHSLCAADA